jgi:hypothetical protein
MFEHLLYTNIIVSKRDVDFWMNAMESFPPESTERAEKKLSEFGHKKPSVPVGDEFADDKKRQAAEIIYLERYE